MLSTASGRPGRFGVLCTASRSSSKTTSTPPICRRRDRRSRSPRTGRTRDAFQVARLRAAGAIVIGKTNLHELASGIVTVSSLGGQTRNPYDPARNPGGSSGGTGAAVAANFAAAGLGTDTCGSIRIPASHNSLVGLRPSAGLSSRAGVIPLSLTQDVAGPLARSVRDVALLLDATVGVDPADPSTTAGRGRTPRSYLDGLGASTLEDVRLGVLTPLFGNAAEDEEVSRVVHASLDVARQRGAVAVNIPMPEPHGAPSRDERDRRGVQVRSGRLPRGRAECAGPLARRDSRARSVSPGARRHVPAPQRHRGAGHGSVPDVARQARSRAESDPRGDGCREGDGSRLSDDPAKSRARGRSAGRRQLPAQPDHRPAGADRARGVHT